MHPYTVSGHILPIEVLVALRKRADAPDELHTACRLASHVSVCAFYCHGSIASQHTNQDRCSCGTRAYFEKNTYGVRPLRCPGVGV